MIQFSKYLRGDEELWRVYHRHGLSYISGWFLGIILLAVGFFFLWPLLSQGTWGLVGFVALLGGGIIALWRTLRLWRGNVMLITSQRVIDVSREGFFGEAVSQVTYNNIQDISWSRRGLAALILRYGTVQLVASGGSIRLVFPYLSHPQQVVSYLISVHEKALAKGSGEEQIKNVLKVKSSTERSQLINNIFGQSK